MTLTTGTPFFGRHSEVSDLVAAHNEALDGKGSVVLIAGDPGIGKTRLASELANRCQIEGGNELRGKTSQHAGAPPYWAWRDAVRDAEGVFATKSLRNATEKAGPYVARAFPELAPYLSLGTSDIQDDPAVSQFRTLTAATSLFTGLSEDRLLLIILEDLHWADEASLQLLEFVTSRIRNRKILIVGTFQDVEINDNHPLTETLNSLGREPNFQLTHLKGLEQDEARSLIESFLGKLTPDFVVDAITQTTERNPLFMTEILKGIVEGNEQVIGHNGTTEFTVKIPPNIRAAIGRRLRRLGPDTLRLLTTASMLGRDFNLPVVEAIDPELSGKPLLNAVDDAKLAGILTEFTDASARYRFAHDLIPMTISEDRDSGAKAEMHAHFASSLEKYYDYPTDEHAAEIAEHCIAAGSLISAAKTAKYSLAAGQQALHGRAFSTAIRWFEVVLEPSVSRSVGAETLAEAHFGAGQCLAPLVSVENKQPAWEHLIRAFELFLRVGKTERSLDAVSHPIAFGRLTGTTDVLLRAVKLAREGSPRLGELLVACANAQIVERENLDAVWAMLEEARQIANRKGDRNLLVHVELSSAMCAYYALDPVKAIQFGQKAELLATELGNTPVISRLAFFLGNSLEVRGRHEEALILLEKGLVFATELNIEHDVMHALRARAQIQFSLGNWEEAIESMTELRRRVPGALTTEFKWMKASVEYELGEVDVIGVIESLRHHNLAFRALRRAAIDNDVSAFAKQFRTYSPRFESAPFVRGWKARRHASLSVTLDDRQSIAYYYELLRPSGIRIDYCTGSTDRLLAQMALLMGRLEDAQNHFCDALDFCRSAGYRPELVMTCFYYAQMLGNRSNFEEIQLAKSLIAEGRKVATSIGMSSMDRMLRELSSSICKNKGQLPATLPDLTKRQFEVLALIGVPSTNKEIANQLVVANHTVARHISNIRSRVGPLSRIELVDLARRVELIREQVEEEERENPE